MIDVLRKMGFVPRSCVWELTLVCNMRCLHCGSYAGASRENELSLEECESVADQLTALGCRQVTLGGGEPTLHPHWHELGGRLTDQGVRVNMISNGWHWTESHVEKAKAAGLVNAAFSLDGFEKDHDAFRREGSYGRVIRTIDRCVAAGLPVAINTTINTYNCRYLPELRDLLAEHGVFSWQLQIATPSGNLSEHLELVIKPEDMLWLVPQIAKMRMETGVRPLVCPGDDVGYFGKFERALRDSGGHIPFWLGCRAGCQVIGIESNGNVKGCLSLPSAMHGEDRFLEGNIRLNSLEAIWNREGAFAYNREFTEDQLAGFCGVCRFREFCRGGCSWTAYSHTKNRFDNPYCLYRQAVKHRRFDLLDEEPTPEELAYVEEEQAPAAAPPGLRPRHLHY